MPMAVELSAGASSVSVDFHCSAPSGLNIAIEGKDGRVLYETAFHRDRQFVFATDSRKILRLRFWAHGEAVVESISFVAGGRKAGLGR
jgi:hypothetical protein